MTSNIIVPDCDSVTDQNPSGPNSNSFQTISELVSPPQWQNDPPQPFAISLQDNMSHEFNEGVTTVTFYTMSMKNNVNDQSAMQLASTLKIAFQRALLKCPVMGGRLSKHIGWHLLDAILVLTGLPDTQQWAPCYKVRFDKKNCCGAYFKVQQMEEELEKRLLSKESQNINSIVTTSNVNSDAAANSKSSPGETEISFHQRVWFNFSKRTPLYDVQSRKLSHHIPWGGTIVNNTKIDKQTGVDQGVLCSLVLSVGKQSNLISLGLSTSHTISDGATHYLFLRLVLNYWNDEMMKVQQSGQQSESSKLKVVANPGPDSNANESSDNHTVRVGMAESSQAKYQSQTQSQTVTQDSQISQSQSSSMWDTKPYPHLSSHLHRQKLPSFRMMRSSLDPCQFYLEGMRFAVFVCKLITRTTELPWIKENDSNSSSSESTASKYKGSSQRQFSIYIPSEKADQIKKNLLTAHSTNDALIDYFAPEDVQIICFPLNCRGRLRDKTGNLIIPSMDELPTTGNVEMLCNYTVPKGEKFSHKHVRECVSGGRTSQRNPNKNDNPMFQQPNFRVASIMTGKGPRDWGWNTWASVAGQFNDVKEIGNTNCSSESGSEFNSLDFLVHDRHYAHDKIFLTCCHWNHVFCVMARPGKPKCDLVLCVASQNPNHARKIVRRCYESKLQFRCQTEKLETTCEVWKYPNHNSDSSESVQLSDEDITKMIYPSKIPDSDANNNSSESEIQIQATTAVTVDIKSQLSHKNIHDKPHWGALCICAPFCIWVSCLHRLWANIICCCFWWLPLRSGSLRE